MHPSAPRVSGNAVAGMHNRLQSLASTSAAAPSRPLRARRAARCRAGPPEGGVGDAVAATGQVRWHAFLRLDVFRARRLYAAALTARVAGEASCPPCVRRELRGGWRLNGFASERHPMLVTSRCRRCPSRSSWTFCGRPARSRWCVAASGALPGAPRISHTPRHDAPLFFVRRKCYRSIHPSRAASYRPRSCNSLEPGLRGASASWTSGCTNR